MPRTFAEVEHDLHTAHRHNYLYHTFATIAGVQGSEILAALRHAGAPDADIEAMRATITALKQQAYAIERARTIDVQPLCDELARSYESERIARRASLEVSRA